MTQPSKDTVSSPPILGRRERSRKRDASLAGLGALLGKRQPRQKRLRSRGRERIGPPPHNSRKAEAFGVSAPQDQKPCCAEETWKRGGGGSQQFQEKGVLELTWQGSAHTAVLGGCLEPGVLLGCSAKNSLCFVGSSPRIKPGLAHPPSPGSAPGQSSLAEDTGQGAGGGQGERGGGEC